MIYALAADALTLFHFLFICFVVFGGLLVAKWRWLALLHIPAAGWGAIIEFQGWICPLTPLEQQLREAAGQAGYNAGFIEHYLMPLVYPKGLDYDMQVVLGTFVIVINAVIYGGIAFYISRRKNS